MASEYGQRLLRFLTKIEKPVESDFFIAVVREFVTEESEIYKSYSNDEDFKNVLDNRNLLMVTPIDSNPRDIQPAIFINSHQMDIPLLGEAVFCIKTNIGNIVIDRFSINQFALNYDGYEFFLNNITDKESLEIQYPENYEENFKKEGISKVAPFFPKQGSNVWLGRNNQYIIFDHGVRKNAGINEQQNTKRGEYVKIGLRKKGNQTDDREDPTLFIIARQAPLTDLISEEIPKNGLLSPEQQPENGVGLQTDQMIFFGREYIVVHSKRDIVIEAIRNMKLKSEKLEIISDKFILDSKEIKLGSENSKQPFVRGNDLIDLLKDFISLIEKGSYLVTGTSAKADPAFIAQLRMFRQRNLNKNSNILSKDIKGI